MFLCHMCGTNGKPEFPTGFKPIGHSNHWTARFKSDSRFRHTARISILCPQHHVHDKDGTFQAQLVTDKDEIFFFSHVGQRNLSP